MTDSAGFSAALCRRVIYTGRVQGVGFRYTTRSIARRYPVTGSVKNLADGTVELVVQGAASAVENVLEEISRQFEGYIAHADVSEREPDPAVTGFSIRH